MNRASGVMRCLMVCSVSGAVANQCCAGFQARSMAPPAKARLRMKISRALTPRGTRKRCNAYAAFIQRAHHDVKAAAFLSQQRVGRELDAIEMQLANLRRALSHLVFFRSLRDARQMAVHDKDAHATLSRRWVGSSEHECDVGDRRVVNP